MKDVKYKLENGFFKNLETGKAIPRGEPTVILRAQDKHAVPLLRQYKKVCTDKGHRKMVQAAINSMLAWQKENKKKVKEPDS